MNARWTIGIAIVAVTALGAAAWALLIRTEDQTYEVFEATVERSTIETTIAATGNVEAMVTVEVGSRVTGQVQRIFADFNSVVTEGQLLVQLDPRNVEAQLRNSQASVRAAESRILTAQADRGSADASLESARANLEIAGLDLALAEVNANRSETLFADGLVPETELEDRRANLRSARASVFSQEASVGQAGAQITSRDAAIEQAYASLEEARADLEEARLNVEYTAIRSPIDGVVISREIDVGQTMSASTSAPTLFVIANDLSQMRVQASIDEADIGLLGHGNRVTFSVDAYPDQVFEGRIQEIRLNSSTAQNVVTYSVIVGFENPSLQVKPGMTANILISVSRRDDVLTVPNTALRYVPPETDPEALPVSRRESDSGSDRLSARGVPAIAPSRQVPGNGMTAAAQSSGSESMPGQEWQDGVKIRFESAPEAAPIAGRVWVMTGSGVPEPRRLTLGLSDGSRTEVVSGDIAEGDLVLIGDTSNLAPAGAPDNGNDPRDMMRALSGGLGR